MLNSFYSHKPPSPLETFTKEGCVACLAAHAQTLHCPHFLPCGEQAGCSRMWHIAVVRRMGTACARAEQGRSGALLQPPPLPRKASAVCSEASPHMHRGFWVHRGNEPLGFFKRLQVTGMKMCGRLLPAECPLREAGPFWKVELNLEAIRQWESC